MGLFHSSAFSFRFLRDRDDYWTIKVIKLPGRKKNNRKQRNEKHFVVFSRWSWKEKKKK